MGKNTCDRDKRRRYFPGNKKANGVEIGKYIVIKERTNRSVKRREDYVICHGGDYEKASEEVWLSLVMEIA